MPIQNFFAASLPQPSPPSTHALPLISHHFTITIQRPIPAHPPPRTQPNMSTYAEQNDHSLSRPDVDVLSSFDDFLTNTDNNPWNFRADLFHVDQTLDSFDPTAIDQSLQNFNPYPPPHSTSSTNDDALNHSSSPSPSPSPIPSPCQSSSPSPPPCNEQSQTYSNANPKEHSQQYSSLATVVSQNGHCQINPSFANPTSSPTTTALSHAEPTRTVHTVHNQDDLLENSELTYRSDDHSSVRHDPCFKGINKPPTTAKITLEDLKQVFDLERPKAEKRLNLKRTTFSNLSRHFGISKWPYRTIRDVRNRQQANEVILREGNISKEKRRKLLEQQRNLEDVINLIYTDPTESRDSNTLAVLLKIVESKRKGARFG